jgi:lambda family phage tail tape measure protein
MATNIVISIVGNTASFDDAAIRALNNARKSAKGIQDSFNSIDISEARGGVMVFDELIGIHIPRHVTGLIATLPGLQAAMAAAFPVLAVLAVAKAIGDLVEKEQKHAEELARQRAAVDDVVTAMAQHAASLQVSNLKLEDQIRLLTGKPGINGPKELAIEAQQAVEKLEKEYDKAIEKIGEFAKSNQQGLLAAIFNSDNGSREVAGRIASHQAADEQIKANRAISEAAGDKEAIARFDKMLADEDTHFKEWAQKQFKTIQNNRPKLVDFGGMKSEGTGEQRMTTAAEAQKSWNDAVESFNSKNATAEFVLAQILNTTTELNKARAEGNTETGDKKEKDALEAINQRVALEKKAFDESQSVLVAKDKATIASAVLQKEQGQITADQLAAIQEAASEREFQAKQAFLEKIKKLEAGNPALVRATQAEIEADTAAHEARLFEIKAQAVRKDNEQDKQDLADLQKYYDKQESAALKAAEFDQKMQAAATKLKELKDEITDADKKSALEVALASGQIDKQEAAEQALKDARDAQAKQLEDINNLLAQEKTKLDALNAATNGGTNGSEQQIEQYRKTALAYAQSEQLKAEITKKTNAEIAKANKDLQATETAQWAQMFRDFQKVSLQMSQAARQSFGQMNTNLTQLVTTGKADFRSLAQSMISDTIKIALQYAESKALMAALDNDYFDQALTALGINTTALKLANGMKAQSSAFAAAANTLADVPYPLNIPASAQVLATGEGYAAASMSAAGGALLPNREALVHTHPQEMVLPKNISQHIIHSMKTSSGEHQAQPHITFAPNINAGFANSKETSAYVGKEIDKKIKMLARKHGKRL